MWDPLTAHVTPVTNFRLDSPGSELDDKPQKNSSIYLPSATEFTPSMFTNLAFSLIHII